MNLTDTALNGNRTKKKLKKSHPSKKFYANAHCTHLSLPANAQCQPKGKVKRVQSPTLYYKTVTAFSEIRIFEP